jgi:hypothetical protein
VATQREGMTKDRRKGVGLLRSARCRLHVHFPLAVVLAIDRDKPRTWPRWRARQFPVPGPFLDEAVRKIAGAGRDRAAHRRRAILASATPCRDGLLGTAVVLARPGHPARAVSNWPNACSPRGGSASPPTARA